MQVRGANLKVERYKEIERSIITNYRKKIWTKFIKGIQEFDMIQYPVPEDTSVSLLPFHIKHCLQQRIPDYYLQQGMY